MTDTKAPERLVTSKCGKTIVHDGMKRFEGDIEWVPYDHALSLVAAAYEKAAKMDAEKRERVTDAGHKRFRKHQHSGGARGQIITEWDGPESHIIEAYAEHIRSLTPADAQAALEARDKRVREEALEEAINKVNQEKPQSYTGMQRVLKTLIEKEQTDE